MQNEHIEELDPFLRNALQGYNNPPPAPMKDMWQAIERQHFGAEVHRLPGRKQWAAPVWFAAAAALVLGVAIGHYGSFMDALSGKSSAPASVANNLNDDPRNNPVGASEETTVSPVAKKDAGFSDMQIDTPYQMAANRFLGQTVALFAVLPGAAKIDRDGLSQRVDAHLVEQASELLSTTRMLLDSPVNHDSELRKLLSDLELVLAQVASAQSVHDPKELNLITEALKQRDVMARLQHAVIRTSGDF